ncbi:putative reverse transcriptase domain-containing protein [Tanacetum coccineum]
MARIWRNGSLSWIYGVWILFLSCLLGSVGAMPPYLPDGYGVLVVKTINTSFFYRFKLPECVPDVLKVWLDGVRYLKGRAWIPRIDNLRDVILDEAHRWRYLIHPGANKMYQDVKEYYWWHGMKKDIELYNDERSRLHMGYSGTVDEFSALPPDERRLQNGEASTTALMKFSKETDRLTGRKKYKMDIIQEMVGDRVLLKVSPWKGMIRFGKRGNLSPRYVGPFQTLEKVGPVAYKLELPQELSGIHNVFHVSSLKKCLTDETLVVLLEEIQITDKLQFIEEPLEIMDRKVK